MGTIGQASISICVAYTCLSRGSEDTRNHAGSSSLAGVTADLPSVQTPRHTLEDMVQARADMWTCVGQEIVLLLPTHIHSQLPRT